MSGVRRLLGIDDASKIAVVVHGLDADRVVESLVKGGLRVTRVDSLEALLRSKGSFAGALLDAGLVGDRWAGPVRLAASLRRVGPDGRVWLLDGPNQMNMRGATVAIPRTAESGEACATLAGYRSRTLGGKVGGRRVCALERPVLSASDASAVRKALGLDGAERVGVFGSPLTYLPTLEAAVSEGTRLHGAWAPGRGAFDALVFFTGWWSDEDSRMLGRRVGPDGVLAMVYQTSMYRPRTLGGLLAPLGLRPKGKAAPLPLGMKGWSVQRFVPDGAAVAKKEPAPRKRPATNKERPAKKPPTRRKPAPAERAPEPSDPLSKRLWKLGRPAAVISSTVQLRSSEVTSVVGQVTWAVPGEGWPLDGDQPLHSLLGIRVDELPHVPKPLENLAYVAVFAGPYEPVVRSYRSLEGLVRLRSPSVRGHARAVRWAGVIDYLDDWTALGQLRKKGGSGPDLASIEAARENDVLEHFHSTKVGGWPSSLQHAPATAGYVMQLVAEGFDGLHYVYRQRNRWSSETAQE